MGSNARLCARCNLTKVTGTRIECRPCGDDTSKHKGFEWQVRKFLEDHDDLKHFTYTDTALPCAAKNASNVRRADFVYVLKDRVVILEVDENEHRYIMPECERKREQQLADSVTAGMYVVIIRYNPMAKGIPWMRNLEKLASVLREAFVTAEVKLANDGIHRVYVGYQMASIRKIDAAYEEVQNGTVQVSPYEHINNLCVYYYQLHRQYTVTRINLNPMIWYLTRTMNWQPTSYAPPIV